MEVGKAAMVEESKDEGDKGEVKVELGGETAKEIWKEI